MSMKKKISIRKRYQLAALCLTGLLSACSGGSKTQEIKDETPKVKLASVTTRPVDQVQEYTATVQAYATNHIAPSSPVRIEKIYVEVGDRVGKGQKLVRMDASGLKQLKLQLDNQATEFARIDELYKIGGVSKSEWEASKMTLEMRQTSYKNMLENTALVSPISGVVTARNYDSGDMYGGGTPVVTVEQIMPVKLLINVSESYFTRIAKNSTVSVRFDVYGEEEFEGKVNLLYPTIEPISSVRAACARTFSPFVGSISGPANRASVSDTSPMGTIRRRWMNIASAMTSTTVQITASTKEKMTISRAAPVNLSLSVMEKTTQDVSIPLY